MSSTCTCRHLIIHALLLVFRFVKNLAYYMKARIKEKNDTLWLPSHRWRILLLKWKLRILEEQNLLVYRPEYAV